MTSIDRTIAKALREDFGPDFDLSNADLFDIQATIAGALVDAGRGNWDEAFEAAEFAAHRYDGTRTLPSWA